MLHYTDIRILLLQHIYPHPVAARLDRHMSLYTAADSSLRLMGWNTLMDIQNRTKRRSFRLDT